MVANPQPKIVFAQNLDDVKSHRWRESLLILPTSTSP